MKQPDISAWFSAQLRKTGFHSKYPGYAFLLARLQPVANPLVPVMGVSESRGRLTLNVNMDFFKSAPEYLPGVLLHELHHVVLGHLTEARFRDAADPRIMMLAQEISANEFISEKLPGTPVILPRFRRFGIRPGQSTLERYQLLLQPYQRGDLDLSPYANMLAAIAITRSLGKVSRLRLPGLIEALARAREDGLFDLDMLISGMLSMDDVVKSLEFTPRAMWSRVDWRSWLQRLSPSRHRRVSDYRRVNRRHASRAGIVPGHSRSAGFRRVMAVIDTSGSMKIMLGAVSAAISRLAREVQITVVECDNQVRRVYPFAGKDIVAVEGGTGTDLRPPFEAQMLKSHRAEAVIYFTDGQGPYPDSPPDLPVLWVLTNDDDFKCPWGLRLRV